MTEQSSDALPTSLEGSDVSPDYVPFPSFREFSTSGFDPTALGQFVALLDDAKSKADPDRLKASVEKATRWAAVDTGAIEGLYQVERGFTFSVAAEAAAWDNIHLELGEPASKAIEDALAAYEFVLDVATGNSPVSEVWIRQLHEVICASQDAYKVVTAAGPQDHALPKGEYKSIPNNPFNLSTRREFAYAPVSDTPAEMARLVKELSTAAFAKAHPVLQAAYAHYAYVRVHPFADGNGRVARAIASIYLYRAPGVPLVIFADQKLAYLDALERADDGDYAPFIHFIEERAIDAVRMVAADLQRPARPPLAQRMADMRASLLGRGGLPHDEVDALGALLFKEWVAAVQRAIADNPVEPPLTLKTQVYSNQNVPLPPTFRPPPTPQTLHVTGQSAPPAAAQIVVQFGVGIAKAGVDGPDYAVVIASESVEEALIRDLSPHVNPALTYRLYVAATDIVMDLIDRTISEAEARLKQTGYK